MILGISLFRLSASCESEILQLIILDKLIFRHFKKVSTLSPNAFYNINTDCCKCPFFNLPFPDSDWTMHFFPTVEEISNSIVIVGSNHSVLLQFYPLTPLQTAKVKSRNIIIKENVMLAYLQSVSVTSSFLNRCT